MALRFSPPPNWPAPPDGWTPPDGWQPDPAWGPAPEGWALWQDDGAHEASEPKLGAWAQMKADMRRIREEGREDQARRKAKYAEQKADLDAKSAERKAEREAKAAAERERRGLAAEESARRIAAAKREAAAAAPAKASTTGGSASTTSAGAAGRDALARARAAASGVDVDGALFVGTSHEDGRNSTVTLWPNRLERTKPRRFVSVSTASQEVDVTPLRSVTHVTTDKDGWSNTKVNVHTAGGVITFRFAHAEAKDFREALLQLIL